MSDFGWNALHDVGSERKLFGFIPANITQGGVNIFKESEIFQSREGFVGWVGFGGSLFQWHPEERVSFAYVPTLIDWSDVGNSAGAQLQETVMQCLNNTRGKDVTNARDVS